MIIPVYFVKINPLKLFQIFIALIDRLNDKLLHGNKSSMSDDRHPLIFQEKYSTYCGNWYLNQSNL